MGQIVYGSVLGRGLREPISAFVSQELLMYAETQGEKVVFIPKLRAKLLRRA